MPAPLYDYTPPAGTLYAVVSTEHEPEVLLGTWLGTTEDVVSYFDSGPDEEVHSAPGDCVRLVKVGPA